MGNQDELGQFIKLTFGNPNEISEVRPEMIWIEDAKHNMVSTRFNNLSFKLYTTTTTLVVQGQDEQRAKSEMYNLSGADPRGSQRCLGHSQMFQK